MKKLNLLVISALLATGLAACGGTDTSSSSETGQTGTSDTGTSQEAPVVDLAALAKEAYGYVSATYDSFANGIGGDQDLATECKTTDEGGKEYVFQIRYSIADSAKEFLAISEAGDKLLVTQGSEEKTLAKALHAEVLYNDEVKHTADHNIRVAKLSAGLKELYDTADGAQVTVTGKLVRVRADGNGYHIADGEHAIYVYTKEALPEGVKVGDYLKVGGELDIYNGLYEVKPNSVEKVEAGSVKEPVTLEVGTIKDPTNKYYQSREAKITDLQIVNITGQHKTSSKGEEYEQVEVTVMADGCTILIHNESRKMTAEDFATWGWDGTKFADTAPKAGQLLTAEGFIDFYKGNVQVSGAKFVSAKDGGGELPEVPEPAVEKKTIEELLALPTTAINDKAFEVTGIMETKDDGDKYGNCYLTDAATGKTIRVYGTTTTETALAWNGVDSYAFNNPKDAVTTLKDIKNGEKVTMKVLYAPFNTERQVNGIITAHVASTDKYTASVVEDPSCTVTLSKSADLAYGEEVTVNVAPKTEGHIVEDAYVVLANGQKVNIKDTLKFNATCVNEVHVVCGEKPAVGAPLTFTVDDIQPKANNYADNLGAKVGDTTIDAIHVGNYGDGIQMRCKAADQHSQFYNTTAFAKPIESIEIAMNAAKTYTKSNMVVETGTSAFNKSVAPAAEMAVASDGATTTYTIPVRTAGDTFFRIAHIGSTIDGTFFISSVTINFVA